MKNIKIQEKYVLRDSVIERINNILNNNQSENIDYDDKEEKFKAKFRENFEEILQRKSKILGLNIPKNQFNIYQRHTEIKNTVSSSSRKLPIFKHKNEILQKISKHTFTLISGDTGCGKSTQVPQMILDHFIAYGKHPECSIICTQPRRISAISLAERVSRERTNKNNKLLQNNMVKSVGYQIRLEKCMPDPKIGTILYCTTGVLLRKMESDPLLRKTSHVILDEIHERSVELDLLIGLLKTVVKYNKNIKIILMSATFCIDEFASYFDDNCAIIQIPGKVYPVEIKYLEDILETIPFECKNEPAGKYTDKEIKEFKKIIEPYAQDLHKTGKFTYNVINIIKNQNSEGVNLLFIKKIIFDIAANKPDGAILAFLPGYDKIEDLFHILTKSQEYNKAKFKIYLLHSLMPTEKQRGIFVRPKKGVRKIILSTTIAETSITIDDVVYIINPGRVKINDYDINNNYEMLVEKWISHAHSQQRQGRAGRCQPGICYNLYTRARELTFTKYSVPEIQRTRLEPVILRLKFMSINNIYEFLQTLINCPDIRSLQSGIQLLKRINALNSDETLTPLGYHMAHLPLDPQIAKMLVISSVFECVDPITSICATLSYKEPFYRSIKKGGNFNLIDVKMELSNGAYSDELVYAYVIEDYHIAKRNGYFDIFVRENFISVSIMKQLIEFKSQLYEILRSTGSISSSPDTYKDKEHLLKGVIAAGLYPNIAYIQISKTEKGKIKQEIITPEDNKSVILHKWTVNRNLSEFDSKFLVYSNKRKGKKEICLHDSTMVYGDSLILFGDNFEAIENNNGQCIIKISDNIEFITDYATLKLIKILRCRFEILLRKLALNLKKTEADKKLVEALILFLSCDLD